ncbi:A24 family peptidase [Phaeobacter sp. J2-8]|uniref:prepilin peptidase n=1 Tax=Phaeobacter sp. J2-8 TaxID=2931394 RepID=UPI001FD3CE6E|nr:A24 family peptidase [Phaeobacter sp. J2-8]MCJ7874792.1 A24 family peptidase [Phaeobacter sp. J2-8]
MVAIDTTAFLLCLTGPAIGSFIAVLVDRLPRGEDVLVSPSQCRSCGNQLGVFDLIPIVSFAVQRGRCRHCAAPIPGFTLYAEILALGAGGLAVLAGGGAVDMVLSAVWLWLLLALAMSDAIWMRLPNILTFSAFVLALVLAVLPYGVGLEAALWGAGLGVGSFALVRWIYEKTRGQVGLGLGDVKLMAGLGAFAGGFALPQLVLIAALAALAGAIVTRNDVKDGLSGIRALPFGTALCLSAALIWLWRGALQNQL